MMTEIEIQQFSEHIQNVYAGKDIRGIDKCPQCKGVLHWEHTAFNNRVWMVCETDNCISFIGTYSFGQCPGESICVI